ncbi:hypothetical protein BDF19DRAFT_134803 [Syncephalis fuscata]|nr:hypothetical protein BDF19DRAFT_134803 [Syncephalis fuscata]
MASYCWANWTGNSVYTDHFLQNRFATVPNRAFLQLSGEDTAKFLQGLITNNMSNIATGGDGFNAVFLTPQGRVLSEVFIYPRNRGVAFPHPVFLIDCPSAQRDILLAHLRKYRLRSKVTIEPIEDYTVSSVWGPATSQLWWRHHSIQNTEAAKWPAGQLIKQNGIGFADIGMLDCRATGMGYRVVTHKEHPLNLPSCFTELTSDDYNTWRILRGVTEGVDDFVSNQSLPLECNLDYMHGVDFRKGCYVGQELTIRTYHKGVIRKRIMPVQLIPATIPEDQWTLVPFSFPSEALPVPGTDMQLYERGALDNNSAGSARSRRAPARLCSVSTNMNVALALLRLEHVQEGRVFLVPGATSQSPNWLANHGFPNGGQKLLMKQHPRR